MITTIIHCAILNAAQQARISRVFGSEPLQTHNHYRVNHSTMLAAAEIEDLRQELGIDINSLPENFNGRDIRLLITDMDSTLINIECVDEIADFVGIKPQVAAITEAAMRGELDFAASLTRRVALLQGLDASALEHVYAERLELNHGAQTLLEGLKKNDVKTALVSGGFTFFTERLKARLALDYTLANVLDIEDGKLTGKVQGEIVGAEAKATFLKQICSELGFSPDQAIAMGDGANDLRMLGIAGLGVAYHAKDKVRMEADVSIQYGGLNKVLDFLA